MRNLKLPRVFVQAMLLALFVCMIPATSNAAVFVSVGFAPPPLPAYDQPPCPEVGWMWTPGYWAYGDDGYYWVPGTWVPSPYEGALWTPGYWGWGDNVYVWHPGYWGSHVGYYGGIDYGFGYMGIGFVGGMWSGGRFRYNTAVMHVDRSVIHNTYDDRGAISSHMVARDSHVAYSGGQGGIHHPPTAQESAYSHEQHRSATSYQTRQEDAARANVNSYAKHNGGHPASAATERPMTGEPHNNGGRTPNSDHGPAGAGSPNHGAGPGTNPGSAHSNGGNHPAPEMHTTPANRPAEPSHRAPENHPAPESHSAPANRPAPETHTAPLNRPAPQPRESRPAPENRPAPRTHTAPMNRPAPQPHESRPAPASRPAPQSHAEPPRGGQPHGGGGGGEHDHGKGH
jgi:hypothetical protein